MSTHVILLSLELRHIAAGEALIQISLSVYITLNNFDNSSLSTADV